MATLDNKHIAVQAGKFVLCGLVSAASYTATIVSLVELAGWHTAAATVVGFTVGTVVSYVLNSLFTFQEELGRSRFARFGTVTLIGLGINIAIVEGAQLVGLHYGFGVFGSLVVAPAFNFLAHRLWTFRDPAS